MPKLVVTPAFSPDVHCDFEVPRDKKAPITFSVPRYDYISDFEPRVTAWLEERMKPIPVLDDDGQPVIGKDGEPETADPESITDREVILKHLEIAGVIAGKIREIAKLTNGELNQIFEFWQAQSRVKVGESVASDNS